MSVLGLGLSKNTYKNIFYYEKESFAAQTPQKRYKRNRLYEKERSVM